MLIRTSWKTAWTLVWATQLTFGAQFSLAANPPSAPQAIRAETPADRDIQPFRWNNPEWYKIGLVKGLLYVSKLADTLQRSNLYATGEDLSRNIVCGPETRLARTADGSCNDPSLPLMGAANTAFSRVAPVAIDRDRAGDGLDPDPRTLSLELMTRNRFRPANYSNFLAAAFFQFLVHDWFAHDKTPEQLKVMTLPGSDPLRQRFGQTYMAFPSTPALEQRPDGVKLYRNKVTHWFDASQVYGSDLEAQRRMRVFKGGLLRMENGYLPVDSDGQEISGNTDNWWIGLSIIHTLFAREHNAIAAALSQRYPKLNDQQLFDKARLINTALITKLFLTEMGQPRFENKIANAQLLANWYGTVNAFTFYRIHGTRANLAPFWEKAFLGFPQLAGFAASPKDLRGVPFAMTEEWAQIYRYHSLLPDAVELPGPGGAIARRIPIENTRGREARKLTHEHSSAQILRAFGYQKAGAVTLNNTPRFFQELDMPLVGRVDIAALDIVRERERGVPRFNQLRRSVGLPGYTSFAELAPGDAELAAKLARLYNNDIERVDTTIGVLVEPKPDGFELGETHFRVLGILALRRLQADHFYTDGFNAKTYTPLGMNWINTTTLKDVLLRHHPDLKQDLKNVNNAFVSWNLKYR